MSIKEDFVSFVWMREENHSTELGRVEHDPKILEEAHKDAYHAFRERGKKN